MIKKVTVYKDETEYAIASQEYAIMIAKHFGARVRLVAMAEGSKSVMDAHIEGEPLDGLLKQSSAELKREAADQGLIIEEDYRGEGVEIALVEESRETDLLVICLPQLSESDIEKNDLRMLKQHMPAIKKMESDILVVNKAPENETFNNIMVWYNKDLESKPALRLAGHVAEKFGASLNVMTLADDRVEAREMADIAAKYLKCFELTELHSTPLEGEKDPDERVKKHAIDSGVDLIVIGDYGKGLFNKLLGKKVGDEAALSTSIPVLFAL